MASSLEQPRRAPIDMRGHPGQVANAESTAPNHVRATGVTHGEPSGGNRDATRPYTAVARTGPSTAPRRNWVAIGLVIFMVVVLVTGVVTIALISRPEPVIPAPSALPAPRTVQIGLLPSDMTTSSDGTRLFVSQHGSIAIVDPATGEKRGEIPFAASTPYRLAVSPDGETLYAATFRKIERIELGANLIGDPISAPGLSGPVAISPNGR